jgi:hypothetical protein
MKKTSINFILNVSKTGIVLLFILNGIFIFSCKEKSTSKNENNLGNLHLSKTVLDPLSLRWTFGNHEPISMYHRAGNRSTGGIEGSALWLEDWHHWYDSEECTKLMQNLGLNILHSRFYKGMGWDYESKDFPNVKRFVENCHNHGIKVLAYVQFSTLYYETMLEEIPDLADWAAIDESGHKRLWNDNYYRWLPCINSSDFETYLKKLIRIALTEGGFDGIMFDNYYAATCYCPHCTELFKEYLSAEPNTEERFGISNVKHIFPPYGRSGYGEIQEPIYQEWIKFRCKRIKELTQHLFVFAKSCKPDAIVSANVANIRRANNPGTNLDPLDYIEIGNSFDLFVSQSGNAPGLEDGFIINRVREFKLAKALKTSILALCDDDAKASEEKYVLTLMEDAVFGGIPTDRTIMKPDRDMVSRELINFRRPILQRFNQTVESEHESLVTEDYEPIKILYSNNSIKFSEKSYRALLGAEEVFLRNHVPYGLLISSDSHPLEIPDNCEVLVVCNQNCLSDNEINTIIQFANRGGRLIITGESGWHEELYRQRRNNPLIDRLKGMDNVSWLADTEFAPVKSGGWKLLVGNPGKAGQHLLESLEKFWSPKIRVFAPETVFVNIKKENEKTFYIHLLNYAPESVRQGIRIGISEKEDIEISESSIALPMENKPKETISFSSDSKGLKSLKLPGFDKYALVTLKLKIK